MSHREQQLREELQYLFFLINYHTQRKEDIWDSQEEFDDYINAALDQINDIKKELKDIEDNNLSQY